ncbi:MAG: hypothetical protein HEQ39_18720 [Rhizobacter sp.]
MNPEKLLAGLAFAVCVVMLLRMALPAPRLGRFDRGFLRAWRQLWTACTDLMHWPARRRAARQAAQDAIRRAQNKPGGQWKGNVYTPDSFGSERDPPSKRDLH